MTRLAVLGVVGLPTGEFDVFLWSASGWQLTLASFGARLGSRIGVYILCSLSGHIS